jgi:ABC-2 type transport system permease protein
MTNLPRTTLSGVSAIWIRELRGRMRGRRAFVFLTFYLAVLGGLLWVGLRAVGGMPLGALESVSVGRGIFASIVLIETLVVMILAPAYTAPSISQEREKQTYDLLAVTPVSSLAIVIGKLLSSLSFVAIIVAASIPLASLAFLFGGVDVVDLVVAYVIILAVALGAGAIGVASSATFQRTQPATVAAFVAVAIAAVGSTATWITLSSRAAEENAPPPPQALLYPNPFVAQADMLCAATGNACLFTEIQPRAVPAMAAPPQPVGPNGGPMPGAGDAMVVPVAVPIAAGSRWPWGVASWLALGAVAMLVAARAMGPVHGALGAPALLRRRARRTEA